ncbi:hypothetical protein BDF19DRAFT_464403 [Syncephalis fuscata]|nr:hypothetical protein BDF19DRAFT_464403 [Syncephalis fuscata]
MTCQVVQIRIASIYSSFYYPSTSFTLNSCLLSIHSAISIAINMAYEVVLKDNTSDKDREDLLRYLQSKGAYITKKYNTSTKSFTFANLLIRKDEIPLAHIIDYIDISD